MHYHHLDTQKDSDGGRGAEHAQGHCESTAHTHTHPHTRKCGVLTDYEHGQVHSKLLDFLICEDAPISLALLEMYAGHAVLCRISEPFLAERTNTIEALAIGCGTKTSPRLVHSGRYVLFASFCRRKIIQ
jgi:hypothetical protein